MRRRKHIQLKWFAFGYLFNTLTTPTSINIICKFHVWMTAVLQNNGNINETWLYKYTQFSSNLTPKKLFCAQSSRTVAYKYLTWLVLAISKFYFLSIAFVLRPRSTKDIVYSLASDKKTTIVRLSILTVIFRKYRHVFNLLFFWYIKDNIRQYIIFLCSCICSFSRSVISSLETKIYIMTQSSRILSWD